MSLTVLFDRANVSNVYPWNGRTLLCFHKDDLLDSIFFLVRQMKEIAHARNGRRSDIWNFWHVLSIDILDANVYLRYIHGSILPNVEDELHGCLARSVRSTIRDKYPC
jgi:hypothetical protein